MRKWIGILLVSLLCTQQIDAYAAKGSIEVEVPKSYEGKLFCAKVGSLERGQYVLDKIYAKSKVDLNRLDTALALSKAAEELFRFAEKAQCINAVKSEKGIVKNLEEGVYLLWGESQSERELLPSLLFLPMWQEETKMMQYELVVVPKFSDRQIPNTGDAGVRVWGIVAGASFFTALAVVLGKEFRKKKRFLP